MPTKREREYYRMGFEDGMRGLRPGGMAASYMSDFDLMKAGYSGEPAFSSKEIRESNIQYRKPKRKLSAWNKYVKANSKKPRFRYRNGKLNLKKMAVAFRKTPAGKKKGRR